MDTPRSLEVMNEYLWAEMPQKKEDKMSKDNKDVFKVGYRDFSNRKEADQYAKRQTAQSFQPQDIYQKIATTVVPEIDVQINSVDVAVEDVK